LAGDLRFEDVDGEPAVGHPRRCQSDRKRRIGPSSAVSWPRYSLCIRRMPSRIVTLSPAAGRTSACFAIWETDPRESSQPRSLFLSAGLSPW
jgi:hypothetical protein